MKIVLLGSGNVATHLGRALQQAGHTIIQVWSRNPAHAEELALRLNSEAISDTGRVKSDADLYILAVKDDAIAEVASRLSLKDQLLVHTSGSTDLRVLEDFSGKIGVIYPLQTFSKRRVLDFSNVPVAVEANGPAVTRELLELAGQISRQVFELDSPKRKALHIAAVFACNFTNYLYTLSAEILSRNDLDFSLLRPIIAETAAKVQEAQPADVQTGPAVRNDMETIERHLNFLKDDPLLVELYEKLSQGIIKFYH